jgi:hypothetical protein
MHEQLPIFGTVLGTVYALSLYHGKREVRMPL